MNSLDTFSKRIDHTVLGPTTTPDDVRDLMTEAAEHGTNACVPPRYVETAAATAPEVTVATVVGFPHGHHEPGVTTHETEVAVERGADELDVVIAVGELLAGNHETVRADLSAVVDATDQPVKAIIETALLSDEQKRAACEIASDAGAAFVKTSTGFADGGAQIADVELMSEYLPVKASGGIGSYEKARAMIEAGADRIGASSGVEIVRGHPAFE